MISDEASIQVISFDNFYLVPVHASRTPVVVKRSSLLQPRARCVIGYSNLLPLIICGCPLQRQGSGGGSDESPFDVIVLAN